MSGEKLLLETFDWFVSNIPQKSNGSESTDAITSVVVFNTLSWTRTGHVTVTLNDLEEASRIVRCPTLIASRTLMDGSISDAHLTAQLSNKEIIFVAENVPEFGYATFSISCSNEPRFQPNGLSVGDIWNAPFVSKFYEVTPGPGGVASVIDRETNLEGEK